MGNEMMQLKWQKPGVIPVVKLGEETQFWMAVEVTRGDETKVHTFLGQYQNRPFDQAEYDKEEDQGLDDCLVDVDGEFVHSVGWVDCKAHAEFNNYYEQFDFNDNYKLLGWAEYTAPKFTPFSA